MAADSQGKQEENKHEGSGRYRQQQRNYTQAQAKEMGCICPADAAL
ncbi:MAG: hypothetical protein ACLR8P_22645 [Clostridium fessum]